MRPYEAKHRRVWDWIGVGPGDIDRGFIAGAFDENRAGLIDDEPGETMNEYHNGIENGEPFVGIPQDVGQFYEEQKRGYGEIYEFQTRHARLRGVMEIL